MELYGPVNKMLCLNYDRGMVMFLACIKVSAAVQPACSSARPTMATVCNWLVSSHSPCNVGQYQTAAYAGCCISSHLMWTACPGPALQHPHFM